jgi:hypothetical protein
VLPAALLEAAKGMICAEDLLILSEVQVCPTSPAGPPNGSLAAIQNHAINHGNKLRSARQLSSRSALYLILATLAY